jgi:hypothetical protein
MLAASGEQSIVDFLGEHHGKIACTDDITKRTTIDPIRLDYGDGKSFGQSPSPGYRAALNGNASELSPRAAGPQGAFLWPTLPDRFGRQLASV